MGRRHEAIVDPHLDDGLARDVKLGGFPVEALDHPGWKIYVYPIHHDSALEVHIVENIFVVIEPTIKFFRGNGFNFLLSHEVPPQ
jgi:hypothetical protein